MGGCPEDGSFPQAGFGHSRAETAELGQGTGQPGMLPAMKRQPRSEDEEDEAQGHAALLTP